MSYKIPPTPNFTELHDIDKRLQSLAQYLKVNLTWLNYSFGLADRLRKYNSEDKVVIYPGAYVSNTTDPFDCHPSDEYTHAFWIAEDEAEISFSEPNSQKREIFYTYQVAVIFFANLELETTQPFNEYRSHKRNEIMSVLSDIRPFTYAGATIVPDCIFTPTGIIENDITKIYEGFTVDAAYNIFKELPYYALRINGLLTFRQDCE